LTRPRVGEENPRAVFLLLGIRKRGIKRGTFYRSREGLSHKKGRNEEKKHVHGTGKELANPKKWAVGFCGLRGVPGS